VARPIITPDWLKAEILRVCLAVGTEPVGFRVNTRIYNLIARASGLYLVPRERLVEVSPDWLALRQDVPFWSGTICHEIAHFLAPGAHHGATWRAAFVRCVAAAHPSAIAEDPGGTYHDLDHWLEAAVRDSLPPSMLED
jgi:hypothetical protein